MSSHSTWPLGKKTCVSVCLFVCIGGSVDGYYLPEMRNRVNRSGRGDRDAAFFWMKLLHVAHTPPLLSPPTSSTPASHWSSLPVTDVRQALLWMSSRARAFILAPVSAPKRLKKRRCKSFKVRVWCNFAEDRRSGERFHARDCPHYINWYPASARTSSPVTIVWILKEEIPKSVQLVQTESRNRVNKVRLIIRLQAICSVFFDACVIMRACVHVGTSSVVQWTCNCVIQQGPPHQEVGYTSPPLSETWQGGGWKKLSLWEKRKQKS